jgi:hypothetical protein
VQEQNQLLEASVADPVKCFLITVKDPGDQLITDPARIRILPGHFCATKKKSMLSSRYRMVVVD